MMTTMKRLIWMLFSGIDSFYCDGGLFALPCRECLPSELLAAIKIKDLTATKLVFRDV